jgi:hypothetical protein
MKSTYKLYNGYDIKGIPDIHDQFTKITLLQSIVFEHFMSDNLTKILCCKEYTKSTKVFIIILHE